MPAGKRCKALLVNRFVLLVSFEVIPVVVLAWCLAAKVLNVRLFWR
jgi:hypothetical protein